MIQKLGPLFHCEPEQSAFECYRGDCTSQLVNFETLEEA